ncbi:unnamed protein product [Camellia sinensis]
MAVRILARNPTFARNPRHIQFEADINRLFLYTSINESSESTSQRNTALTRSGLGLAVGRMSPQNKSPGLKNLIGYTLELKPSQIPHTDAGQGFFIDGQADVGTVIAFYPGIIYSPAYYRYIPGYPRVDIHNSNLITRPNVKDDANNKGFDHIWKMLNKPLQATRVASSGDVLEQRNPLAFAHFANHPAKEMVPTVMVCPYDFRLTEKDMRTYIPNIKFGSGEEAKMKNVLVLKALVLVATRPLCDEEVLLNYRLSNSKRRQSWYTPVDEEGDSRRWS